MSKRPVDARRRRLGVIGGASALGGVLALSACAQITVAPPVATAGVEGAGTPPPGPPFGPPPAHPFGPPPGHGPALAAGPGGPAGAGGDGAAAPRAGWTPPRPPPGRPGIADPARLQVMLRHELDGLGATDEQRKQLLAIASRSQAALAPLHERMHDGRSRTLQLLAAETIDRAALASLDKQSRDDMLQIAQIKSQALLDAAQVLTPAQRATLRDRIERGPQRPPGPPPFGF